MAVIGSPTALVGQDDPSVACSFAVGGVALPPDKGPGTRKPAHDRTVIPGST